MMIRAEHISYRADGKPILDDIHVSFEPGLFHVLLGPNGSGKSTFLKIAGGALKPGSGTVHYGNQAAGSMPARNLAKLRAVMSQHAHLHFPLTVEEVVMMGRYPYFEQRPSEKDIEVCRNIMEYLELSVMATRNYLTLSGGERQRVQFARAMAQIGDPLEACGKILFLDEAVSNLDIRFQHQLLDIAKKRCTENLTVICILHDLNLAIRYADRFLFMKSGRMIHGISDPFEITPALLRSVYDVDMQVFFPGSGDKPFIMM